MCIRDSDSTFLVKVASEVLPRDKILAVTAQSPTYPPSEYQEALKLVKKMKVKHLSITTQELKDNNFVTNPPARCYYCKYELFTRLKEIAQQNRIEYVADGTNLDDIKFDYRPGLRASQELGICHPLQEASLTKEDIRALSKYLDLPTWNKPAAACLASRIPYGEKITSKKLTMIAEAEEFLNKLGFRTLRVRYHGKIARIEIALEEFKRIIKPQIRNEIIGKFKDLGFIYTTLDLQGYRTGSLNEILDLPN